MATATETDLVTTFKALSNPTRLRILQWLGDPAEHFPAQDRPADEVGVCVKQIQAKACVSQSTTSAFMATLQRAGLVSSQRLGQWTYYKREDERLRELSELMRTEL